MGDPALVSEEQLRMAYADMVAKAERLEHENMRLTGERNDAREAWKHAYFSKEGKGETRYARDKFLVTSPGDMEVRNG
jgi:hypothetical protein